MKGSRTTPWGFVDDQYVDHTRYDPKESPNAGRKSDPGNPEGDYEGIKLVDGKPQIMGRDGKAGNDGGNFYIKRGDEVAFDDSRFKPGDEVASYLANELNKRYAFGFAAFDNAQVRHATVDDPLFMIFKK